MLVVVSALPAPAVARGWSSIRVRPVSGAAVAAGPSPGLPATVGVLPSVDPRSSGAGRGTRLCVAAPLVSPLAVGVVVMGGAGTEGSSGETGDEQGAHEEKLGMLPRRFNPRASRGDWIAGPDSRAVSSFGQLNASSRSPRLRSVGRPRPRSAWLVTERLDDVLDRAPSEATIDRRTELAQRSLRRSRLEPRQDRGDPRATSAPSSQRA